MLENTNLIPATGILEPSRHTGVAPPLASTAANERQAVQSVDHLLIRRFNDGDARAFEILVTKYQRRIAWLIDKQVRNAAVAEELTQEVFLRVYRGLPQFRFESSFETWLYAIARNFATSYYRDGHMLADNAVPMETLAVSGGPHEGAPPERTSPSPEDDLSGQQLLKAILQSIENLSPKMRCSITMHEMDDRSYAEIADELHIPLNTVRSLIFRARATIALDIRLLLDSAIF